MANRFYPKGAEGILDGTIVLTTHDIRAILTDLAQYTYSTAHDNLDDIAVAARAAVTATLTGVTVTSGVLDIADSTFGIVAAGPVLGAIILYKHTGTESTSRLIAYLDSVNRLPITPTGVALPLVWHASGLVDLTGVWA